MNLYNKWPNCEIHKSNPATHYNFHQGCSTCGGLDCGDTPCVMLLCDKCAEMWGTPILIPFVLCDPVEYLYDRFFEER